MEGLLRIREGAGRAGPVGEVASPNLAQLRHERLTARETGEGSQLPPRRRVERPDRRLVPIPVERPCEEDLAALRDPRGVTPLLAGCAWHAGDCMGSGSVEDSRGIHHGQKQALRIDVYSITSFS